MVTPPAILPSSTRLCMKVDNSSTLAEETPTSSGLAVGSSWPEEGRAKTKAIMHDAQPYHVGLVKFMLSSSQFTPLQFDQIALQSRFLPTAQNTLQLTGDGNANVLPPGTCHDLDSDWNTVRACSGPHYRRWPARQVVCVGVSETGNHFVNRVFDGQAGISVHRAKDHIVAGQETVHIGPELLPMSEETVEFVAGKWLQVFDVLKERARISSYQPAPRGTSGVPRRPK